MDKNRHKIKAFIDNMDYGSNKDVKQLQKHLNFYQGPDNPNRGPGYYEKDNLLKLDGMYGEKTKGRRNLFLQQYEKATQDSVFDAVDKKRLDFYRNWQWTSPKDTLKR